jgi:predicted dehydrogenase
MPSFAVSLPVEKDREMAGGWGDKLKQAVDSRRPKVRLGIAGDDPFADSIAMAYSARFDVIPSAVWHPDEKTAVNRASHWGFELGTADFDLFRNQVDAVELLESGGDAAALAKSAMNAGCHLSMRRPFARTLDQADELLRAANPNRVFRVLDDGVFYAPHRKVVELLAKEEVGEVSNVRISTNLAGNGGAGWPIPDLLGRYLFADPFDKFGAAVSMFGPAEQVQAYLNPMHPDSGGQGVALVKFARTGLYGIFESSFSPDANIRSNSYPAHENIEIGGTGGFIWVNRFNSPTFEPAISVRMPDSYYQLGVETSLNYERESAHVLGAEDFVSACLRKKPTLYPATLARHALALLLAAHEASEQHKVISLA